MDNRISWDSYFLEMAFLAAKRSSCLRRHIGAVLVKKQPSAVNGI